jgi:hypothetical protein
MATGQLTNKSINPLCPAGCRHLLTMPDAETAWDAREEAIQAFGGKKGWDAILVKGHYGPIGIVASKFHTPWMVRTHGWTAFLNAKDFPLEAS